MLKEFIFTVWYFLKAKVWFILLSIVMKTSNTIRKHISSNLNTKQFKRRTMTYIKVFRMIVYCDHKVDTYLTKTENHMENCRIMLREKYDIWV